MSHLTTDIYILDHTEQDLINGCKIVQVIAEAVGTILKVLRQTMKI